jgi:hypothetical protein
MQNHEHNNQKHVISVQATNNDKIVNWLGYCRTCRTPKIVLPAGDAEIVSRIIHSVQATNKKDKACAEPCRAQERQACAQNHVGHKKDKPAQSVGHMLESLLKGY